MKFILPVGLLVIAILTQSFADEHEHEHGHNHDDGKFKIIVVFRVIN